MRLLLLGNWHAGSNAAQYARAFRQLGHDVTTVGPRFTLPDISRWYESLTTHRWTTPDEAQAYVLDVLAQSEVPDIETEKGEVLSASRLPIKGNEVDAVLSFWAYGETPFLVVHTDIPNALVVGDTHTGHLAEQVQASRLWDHVFVQFRRADLAAFDHPSKHWLPAAADPEVWRPMPGWDKRYDVVFCGSTDPTAHRDRVALIDSLKGQGIAVHVAHAYGEKAARLYSEARVVLNRSLAGDLNMRVPEALACGALLLTDNVDGLPDLFTPGVDYLGYGTPAKAARLIRAALEEARDDDGGGPQVGRGARARVLAAHTYAHRAQQILDTLFPGDRDTEEERTDAHGLPERDDHPALLGGGGAGGGLRRDQRPGGAAGAGGAAGDLAPRVTGSVTVVVPAYGHAEMTVRLRDWLRARHPAAEVVIVDDGTPGGMPAITALRHPENRGFAAACNTGAAAAAGRVLVFLNNDTTPEPGWLDPLVDEADASGGLAGALILNPDGSVQSAGVVQGDDGAWGNDTAWAAGRDLTGEKARDVPAVMGACLAVRRDVFWRLGGFDTGFPSGGEDVDLCLRAQKAGLPVRLVPASRVRHAEGTTRGALPDTPAKIAASVRRLHERWDGLEGLEGRTNDDDGRANSGGPGDGGGAAGGAAGPAAGDAAGLRVGLRPGDHALPGDAARAGQAARRVVVWAGPWGAAAGGSLGVVNAALAAALDDRPDIAVHDERDDHPPGGYVYVSHYWPGADTAHRPPPHGARAWVVCQAWEMGAPPRAWEATWAHPKFRKLVTFSAYSKRLFLEHTSLREDQVQVIPCGVDPAVFTPEGAVVRAVVDGATFRALYVGGTTWRKGWAGAVNGGLPEARDGDLLLRAWARAFAPDDRTARLTIKDTGTETFYQGQGARERITRDPHRRFTYYCNDTYTSADMAVLYRSCHVLVAPSRAEGFCLPALEAMACGLPVIVPGAGPTDEFTDAACALHVPVTWHADLDSGARYYECDGDALARALRWCATHPQEARAMGQRGRQRVLTGGYTWAAIAARWAALLHTVGEDAGAGQEGA